MRDAGSTCGGRNVALSKIVAARSRLELPESGSYLRSNLVCTRDYYVTAAIFAAYGAERQARLDRDQEAKQHAASKVSSVKSAKSMCSSAHHVANSGPGCSTLNIVPCP